MMMSPFKIFRRQHLCCLLLFLFFSCTSPSGENIPVIKKDSLIELKKEKQIFSMIFDVTKSVQSGDLILRTGKDFTSDVMRRVSKTDTTYSHCGIAVWENDSLFVYHALGGEWNPDEKIRRDPFALFCNPFENRGIGIYRFDLGNSTKLKFIKEAQRYAATVLFDNHFDLSSDDRMYCAEYVYKCLEKATGDSSLIPTSSFKQIKYVAIDNLFINQIAKEVKRVKY
ncbi:MAG: YiiX/YebB-like N1pC/P60 family cysteine hydrolase [Ginsengibacter sp.]